MRSSHVALAFLPPEDVVSTFETLMDEPFFVENEALLSDFVTYFEKTWIGSMNRRRTQRLPPLFSITLWNCYHSVLEGTPKTNNFCEGFHRRFSVLLGAAHPTIYKFIDGLRKQQASTETVIQQFLAGALQPHVIPQSIADLQEVVANYGADGFSVTEHLQRLAYRTFL